jgi:Na+/proline symporter
MGNPLIWIGLTVIVIIVIAFITNPLVTFFGSIIQLQTLALMLLIPFLIGLIVGYFVRMGQERRRPVTKI